MSKIKSLRVENHLSQKQLAEQLGISQNAVSQWEKGNRSPSLEMVIRMAEIFNVPAADLLDSKKYANLPNIQTASVPSETHKIPIVGSVACSWNEGFIDDFDGEYSFINDYLYDKYGDAVRATYARGDSMVDKISPGDLLIVIPAYDVENNDIVIATICGDELTAKKFRYNDCGGFDLIPENASYSPQSFTEAQIKKLPVQIVGRVIEIRKSLRE